MATGEFDNMYKFLSEYNDVISERIPEYLKCGKCQNILIKACQIQCGCSFCCVCINSMMENGVENCPGDTVLCQTILLSNSYLDNKTNNEISTLMIKCPEELCLYESTIIDMEDHLRVCGKKSVKCPFAYFGCDDSKMSNESINDHCQSANLLHFKILIEMIDNVRNEIVGMKVLENQNKNDINLLKQKEERSQKKIEELEENLKIKDELIDLINQEIKSIKIEKENLQQEFELFKQNLGSKIEKFKKTIDGEIEENKMKNNEEGNIYDFVENNKDEIQFEEKIKIEFNQDELKEINELKTRLIEWTIDGLDEKKSRGGGIWSECFTGLIHKYQFQLLFHGNGFGDILGKGCSLFLYIWPGFHDQSLPWPFTADVTIKIVNKYSRKIKKIITKHCEINKPLSYPNNCSGRFDYLYPDLIDDGILVDNCFIVECFVNFQKHT